MTIYEYYRDVYKGDVPESEITPYLRAADLLINTCICGCVPLGEERDTVNEAVCIQGEYIYYGGDDDRGGSIGSCTFGKGNGELISPRAVLLLQGAGLTYRGGIL
ncbi:MAG: hypothetical protein IKP75_04395 [Oscillospiraceae bacterium]|nr:hypothetical protein [Oscillospiraceae bacterium]